MLRAVSRFSRSRLQKAFSLLVLYLQQSSFSSNAILATLDSQCKAPSSPKKFHHMVVLVHGYLGSSREQEYFGEALLAESEKIGSRAACAQKSDHKLSILYSKANTKDSTDGVANGGKRLAAEISEWIEEQIQLVSKSDQENSTIMTLSVIGNSLGGLYSRYALTELDVFQKDDHRIRPLIFCTTSSPHLGVSQETFIELPKWTEPYVSSLFMQQTMDDLFSANNSTVVMDMCHPKHPSKDFLSPLGRFAKRIAVANAYNTDFLVSVSSGAFLSSESDSVHHHPESLSEPSCRLMKDTEHVALQVVTKAASQEEPESKETCASALDNLGWLKIFIDTRGILPSIFNLATPKLPSKASYTSMELQDHFKRYGTLLPIAHPLNMANSKTDWYRKLTQSGQPVVDALAELVVLDMIELSQTEEDRKASTTEQQ